MQQLSLFIQKEETKPEEEIKKSAEVKPVAEKSIDITDKNNDDIIFNTEESIEEITLEQQDEIVNEAGSLNDIITADNNKDVQKTYQENKLKIVTAVKKRGRKSLKTLEAEADLIDVPDDETLFKKQYHTIADVSRWFNVNPSLLRYWTNEFTILKPKKNKKGDRFFRPEDVKNLKLIHHLLRERKYTIEGAKSYLKANAQKVDTNIQLLKTLNNIKAFILELKAQLEHQK